MIPWSIGATLCSKRLRAGSSYGLELGWGGVRATVTGGMVCLSVPVERVADNMVNIHNCGFYQPVYIS